MEWLQYNDSCQIAPKDIPVRWIQTYIIIIIIIMQVHTKNNLPDQFTHLPSLRQTFRFGNSHRTNLSIPVRKGRSQSLDSQSDKET